jgi:peptidoglycan/xylan/chitin deacetylase (PgdA/CDA1 family)
MFRKLMLLLLLFSFLFSCRLTTHPVKKELVVVFTFDDNYPSVLQNAVPIMNQYGYRGTMFVNSGNVGNPLYMSWQQLSVLYNQHGWEIGGHTLHHDNLCILTPEEADYVIRADYDSLNAHGFAPVSFATSFGICPTEYYPIILQYYRNLRTCMDNVMYCPIDRTFLGCYPAVISLSPQDVENRVLQAASDNENLVILLFHRISPGMPNVSNYEPEDFADVVLRMHNLGVKVLPLNEALDYLDSIEPE